MVVQHLYSDRPSCAGPWDRAQHIALEALMNRQCVWEHDKEEKWPMTIAALAYSCVVGEEKSTQISNLSPPTTMASLEFIGRHKDGDFGSVDGLVGAFQVF